MSDERTEVQIHEDKRRAAAEAADPSAEPRTDDPQVAALLREREGYVTRGLDDRVSQVDEQLRLHGYEEGGEKSARTKAPTGRRAPGKQAG